MRLEQLKAFLEVAEAGSFQRAAQRCSVTQSTVSRQIQNLESELGLPLFHRGAQVKLTTAGEQFFPRARRICQEWDTASQELADFKSGKQPELCVAGIHSVCAFHLPAILPAFCQAYPNVQLRVTSLGSDRALKVLRDGLVDAAIVMNNPLLTANAEIIIDSLYVEPVQVMLAADHPLAQQSELSWRDLAAYPHVVFKDGYGMQRLVQEQFRRQKLAFKPSLELNTLDAFRGVVRQGNTVALLPQSAMQDVDSDKGLVVRPTVTPHITREVVFVTTRDRLNIPPIQHFRQLVSQHLAQERILQGAGYLSDQLS
ncbi:MAG: LysR family transcriptional regulator [Cyanobacteria bacterium P01_A01_bin.135]